MFLMNQTIRLGGKKDISFMFRGYQRYLCTGPIFMPNPAYPVEFKH